MRAGQATAVVVAALAFAGLPACETLNAEPDVAAVITNPDEQSRAELQRVVDAALRTHVTVAAAALTRNSWLVIEQTPPGSIGTNAAKGRNMSTPIRLQLVRSGGDCVLVDQRNGNRHMLNHVNCRPE